MKRISIIGCCGAGKSTLAYRLHELTSLPLIHLDREFWHANWQPSEKKEFWERMQSIYQKDKWIIDGHYYSTLEERLARSDTVFHLDYSTPVCLMRTMKRMIKGYGKDRLDCAKDCPERFELSFLRYVVMFRQTFRERTMQLLARYPHLNVYRFHHPRELSDYLVEANKEAPPMDFF